MMMTKLPHRGVLEIQGEDKASFLQGLISNDVTQVTPEQAIYATLLSPQGRYLYDFFIMEKGGSYFLDAEAARLLDLVKRLSLYKLRSAVTLIPRHDLNVYALWGENIAAALDLKTERGNAHSDVYMDPRLVELGARQMAEYPPTGFEQVPFEAYDLHRLMWGIPEGGADIIPDKSTLLESGMDELNAISWTKGCYIGQELTTRSKFVGQVRKRLLPVKIEGPSPDFGAEIFLGETAVGSMRTHRDGYGLALLRLEHIKIDGEGETPLQCNGIILRPYRPEWMKGAD
ncbi:MAG: folate-binding protein YgfZ [Alphaproteobacteria bacterium]|nr:folate-binding protein YgfZ [Alphaproteobacteria bacterium]